MKFKLFEKFDYLLFICMLILSCLGIAFIYSSGVNSYGILVTKEYLKQIIWFGVGLVIMILTSLYDYRRYMRSAPIMFGIMMFILILTSIFSPKVNGARSWIHIGGFGFQPSEISKLFYIIFFAWYLERSQNETPRKRFLISFLYLLIPIGIIMLQPDLGTASVFLPIFIFMCFIANIPLRYILFFVCTGALTILLTILPIWESQILKRTIPIITNVFRNNKVIILMMSATLVITIIGLIGQILFKKKYYYWISYIFGIFTISLVFSFVADKLIEQNKFLKEYQIQRLIVFLDPSTDPKGYGWNLIQSKIAIGSGNFWGQGFIRGTQSHYRFLPQRSTDFIFSILAEEMGFAGGFFVVALFLIIFMRIIYIIKQTTNQFGTYIASGILGMLFFHFIINVGMVMGIMPITGIPLPFLSYGGSALITNMAAIGILMSINSRRLDFAQAV